MNTMDDRPQAFNSQRREQRHTDDGSTNTFLPTSTSSGNFLLPDAHGQFTFSAEPTSMIDYSSMTAPTGQETVFTPNTASSFDSSLHPDVINQTYPPAHVYMQTNHYSLSPHSRNGQSISPSHSVDHLSPETGYMSDPSYQDLSNYATPTFNGQFLDESFQQLNFADRVGSQAFPPYQGEVDMAMLARNTLATYNAQAPTIPSNARLDSHSQLLSPCPTNNPSPVVTDEMSRNANFSNVQYTGLEYNSSSTPPSRTALPQHSTPIKQQKQQQQQPSPALTNSPSNLSLANPQPRATHLTSPIVRVENYGGRDSPSHSDISRPMSKRSHGSRRSGNHLSPFPNDESSDDGGDDDDMQRPVRVQPVVRSAQRNDDGSWIISRASGQAGLTPEDRDAIGDAWIPSLDESADHRKKEEKKLDVHDWLSKSEVGSEAGDGGSSTNLLKPFTTRRRAKSTNDAHGRQAMGPGYGLGVRTDFDRFDDSNIPGPGLYIDERSENDDESDEEEEVPESPPAEVSVVANQVDNEASYFPPIQHGGLLGAIVRPWVDVPSQPATSTTRYQPPTSSAAMMRFRIRAKDVESASLAATVGSRRLSESDLGSIRAAPGVIKAIEPDLKKQKDRQRRPSFLENILPTRKPTNLLKRKGSIPVQPQSQENVAEKPKEPVMEKPKRMGSWGRPKSPRLDTTVAIHTRDIGPPSSTGLTPNTGTWYQGAKNAIRRSRSRSDIGKSPGLAELMTQHGGPPMPMLASPLAETEATKLSAQQSPTGDDDEDDVQDVITMNLEVRSDPIIPTPEGFKTHARQLNPRLTDYMVERITQEQVRRYKRLLEFKVKHRIAVENGNCSSSSSSHNFCTELGGDSKQLTPKAGNKDSEAPFLGFQVTAPGSDDDDGETPAEGTLAAAGFPSGVPLPPVKRLPAEFECPLCFKVKKFYKPSDWTKHVHEDVQPFTCTFPNCGEPKSFKRKADWVRHENERHRQLEHWTCQIADCNHTCYRKDNFVQHLVREHKIAEPRQRTGKGAAKDAPGNADSDDIWGLVARCRRDTTKQPKDEPCRFCGNICTSWKKLTVHLAKHMEQISMPILPLVDQKQISADTVISPVVEIPESRKLSVTPNRSPVDNPSRYNPNSTLAPGIDPSYGQYPSDSPGAASSVMHTYPPPQIVPYKNPQEQVPSSNYASYALQNPHNYSGRTYPGLQEPSKGRGAYVNNLQIPNQQYMNGNLQNGGNRFPMTPVSAIGQQAPMFNTSPVDTATFSTDTMASQYFTQEPQSMGSNGMTDMSGFDTTNPIQYQQPATYPDMAYMTAPQRNYQYQAQ
ncbi:uncharacterized protein CC84DRAFT_1142028 [Paraphaeosphaeria sporulosa]|uniref:C2H2-type domain-containing protein n=1 Tax=Paraphaeosphaeria sporulosa TaxID=1460663 RepID=A0A177CPS6_9PLEO|nr:uncharacterized protein CC84DRAFT_1142028 [Paraphaeosphaeria sporulosa]OAG08952.1 hypothetical protein CC84DRAFT_1142028 [Paraphaeosphaeria sporulosa]